MFSGSMMTLNIQEVAGDFSDQDSRAEAKAEERAALT